MATKVKILILSGEKSPYRATLKKALDPSFEVSFISSISEITTSIGAFKPNVFIHDWTATDESQGRQFHFRYSQVSNEENIFRVIVATKITPSLLAFVNDTYVDKVIDYATAKLNLSPQIEMLINNAGHKAILDLIKATKSGGSRYSQKEIDILVENTYLNFPHDVNVKLEMGNLRLRQDNPSKAREIATALLAETPHNMRAVNLLSRIAMKEGKWDEAQKLLAKANTISPKNGERLLMLGDACYGKGDLDAALEFYKEAAGSNPDLAEKAQSAMGKVKVSQGDLEGALGLLQKSASEEEAAGYFNNAAVIAVKNGDSKHAIELYETALKALKTDKLKHIIFYNLALSYRRVGSNEEAVKFTKRALKYKPDFDKAKRQLSQLENTSVQAKSS